VLFILALISTVYPIFVSLGMNLSIPTGYVPFLFWGLVITSALFFILIPVVIINGNARPRDDQYVFRDVKLQYIDPDFRVDATSYSSQFPKYVTNKRTKKTYTVSRELFDNYVKKKRINSFERHSSDGQFKKWLSSQGYDPPVELEPELKDLDAHRRRDGSVFYYQYSLNQQILDNLIKLKESGRFPRYEFAYIHFCRDRFFKSMKYRNTPTARRLLLNYDTGIACDPPTGDLWLADHAIIPACEYYKHFPFEKIKIWCFLQGIFQTKFKYNSMQKMEISDLINEKNLRKNLV
jgi:hypothetical protein